MNSLAYNNDHTVCKFISRRYDLREDKCFGRLGWYCAHQSRQAGMMLYATHLRNARLKLLLMDGHTSWVSWELITWRECHMVNSNDESQSRDVSALWWTAMVRVDNVMCVPPSKQRWQNSITWHECHLVDSNGESITWREGNFVSSDDESITW